MTWMRAHLDLLLLPPIGALLMLLCAWGQARLLRRGKPFTPFMGTMIVYAPLFILGMGYSMVLSMEVFASKRIWIPITIGWTVFLFVLGRSRYRKLRARVVHVNGAE
jgi:hypothetical protein